MQQVFSNQAGRLSKVLKEMNTGFLIRTSRLAGRTRSTDPRSNCHHLSLYFPQEDCIARYKLLVELVQKKKQAKS